jgi:16S rRNA (guanine527-N7)-methyltransferase
MENQDRAAFLAAEDVSRETLDRLDRVIDTLDSWRLRSNLIGPREWPVIWTRHVADCFQLLDHLPAETQESSTSDLAPDFPVWSSRRLDRRAT